MMDYESLTEKPFQVLQTFCTNVLKKSSMERIFEGTDRYNVAKDEIHPDGLIIIKSELFELWCSNICIKQTDSSSEVLSLYLAFRKIFNISVKSTKKTLTGLMNFWVFFVFISVYICIIF